MNPDKNVISVNQEVSLDEKRAQLARVLSSATLQNAPMLQKLLLYLGTHVTEDAADELNEWVIATTVFGRPKEFDSATDTTVRTSVYRLRSKLREYYGGEGKHDPIGIEIPKGHHLPVFTKREQIEDCAATGVPEPREPISAAVAVVTTAAPNRRWMLPVAVLVALAAGVLAGRVWSGNKPVAAASSAMPARRAGAFWRAFADGKPVIVAYSNAELLQTDTRDLVRFDKGAVDDRGSLVDPSLAGRSVKNPAMLNGHSLFYEDGYTGTGEVQSAFSITRLLTQLGIDIQVKRVRLLTSDDFKGHNVVLLGSTLENRAIDDLRLHQGFAFELPLKSMWVGGITDTRSAKNGNDVTYTIERDPATQALRVDYAILSLQPGVTTNSRILVLGGLTTSGTQGAAEYITSDASVMDLVTRLSWPQNPVQPLPTFESVLQVRVVRGLDPVSVKCVTARATTNP